MFCNLPMMYLGRNILNYYKNTKTCMSALPLAQSNPHHVQKQEAWSWGLTCCKKNADLAWIFLLEVFHKILMEVLILHANLKRASFVFSSQVDVFKETVFCDLLGLEKKNTKLQSIQKGYHTEHHCYSSISTVLQPCPFS